MKKATAECTRGAAEHGTMATVDPIGDKAARLSPYERELVLYIVDGLADGFVVGPELDAVTSTPELEAIAELVATRRSAA